MTPPYYPSICLTLILMQLLYGCCHSPQNEMACELPYDLLNEGDLVFRRGTGIVSLAVISADKGGEYSHIGILVQDSGIWKVVHAVPGEPEFKGDPDRVKMEDIRTFFSSSKATTGAIMRATNDEVIQKRLTNRAIRLYKSHILFDHAYDLKDSTQMYCTELIDYIFKQEGIDLPEERISLVSLPGFSGTYLFPSDIFRSNKLRLIYNF